MDRLFNDTENVVTPILVSDIFAKLRNTVEGGRGDLATGLQYVLTNVSQTLYFGS